MILKFFSNYKVFHFFLILLAVLFLSFPLLADTLILKNKKVYKGKVLSQTETNISFRTNDGQQLNFQKKAVLKVVYKDLNEQETKKVIQEEEKKIAKTTTTQEEVQEIPPTKEEIPEPTVTKTPDKRTWFSIVWRSALIPGWGQLKAERYYSAGFAFLFTLGALGSAYSSVNNLQTAENNYRVLSSLTPVITASGGTGDPTGSLVIGTLYNQVVFSGYQSNVSKANNSVQVLTVLYGLQLIHAFFVGRAWEKEEPPSSMHLIKGWNVSFTSGTRLPNRETYQVQFEYTFRF
ncbi:MAG: hypothetical protein N3A69_00325 [Leptospiraceae bacterium]|nr:hypothetical protein [Leptospiraceae bacterium]